MANMSNRPWSLSRSANPAFARQQRPVEPVPDTAGQHEQDDGQRLLAPVREEVDEQQAEHAPAPPGQQHEAEEEDRQQQVEVPRGVGRDPVGDQDRRRPGPRTPSRRTRPPTGTWWRTPGRPGRAWRAGTASPRPLNSPAYRTRPVEKTSIPPRVKNITSNSSSRISPAGIWSSTSQPEPVVADREHGDPDDDAAQQHRDQAHRASCRTAAVPAFRTSRQRSRWNSQPWETAARHSCPGPLGGGLLGQLQEHVLQRPVQAGLFPQGRPACRSRSAGRARRCRSGRPAPGPCPASASRGTRSSPASPRPAAGPSAARMLFGSRPTVGSSAISTFGSWTRAAANTVRCRIPCEYRSVRSSTNSCRSNRSMTACIALGGPVPRHAVQVGDELEELAAGELLVQERLVGDVAR